MCFKLKNNWYFEKSYALGGHLLHFMSSYCFILHNYKLIMQLYSTKFYNLWRIIKKQLELFSNDTILLHITHQI